MPGVIGKIRLLLTSAKNFYSSTELIHRHDRVSSGFLASLKEDKSSKDLYKNDKSFTS